MKNQFRNLCLSFLFMFCVSNQISAQSVFCLNNDLDEYTYYGVPTNFDYTCM